MTDQVKSVEETQNADAAAVETTTEAASSIDYKAELDKVTKERDNYQVGMLIAKKKLKEREYEPENESPDIDAIVERKLQEVLPRLQSQIATEQVDTVLNQLSNDPSERELIKYHFENSVGLAGTIRERIENAQAIANKKALLRSQSEIRKALDNKAPVATTSQGGNTEVSKPSGADDYFSEEQIREIKAKHPNVNIEKLKENMRKLN